MINKEEKMRSLAVLGWVSGLDREHVKKTLPDISEEMLDEIYARPDREIVRDAFMRVAEQVDLTTGEGKAIDPWGCDEADRTAMSLINSLGKL